MSNIFEGRVWKFGDEIDTEVMVPATAMALPDSEMAKYCFSVNRPGWVDQVKKGDIIVAGKNFGIGSSRPGSKVLKTLGISCILAESINGLFLRNCVNFGLPALPCIGIHEAFEEGDMAKIFFSEGRIVNQSRGREISTTPLPNLLINIIEAGGIIPLLDARGLLEKT